jgi:metallo-beta-lactamase family protein
MSRHAECFDDEARALVEAGEDPVGFRPLKFASTREESQAINRIRGSAIIISASGMCNAGRIKHHLAQNLSRPECTILFTGYQAEHTLGRQLVEGAGEVRLFGERCRVRARVESIDGLSGHADRDGLLDWLGALKRAPEKVCLVHGDPGVAEHFAASVRERFGWECLRAEHEQIMEF